MTVEFKFKAILPPEFKEGVVRVWLLNEIRKINVEIKKDFQRTVATFRKKPKFKSYPPSLAGGVIRIGVYTNDEHYARLSEGVEAGIRELSPDKKAFRLPAVYAPKTIVGVIDAVHGGESGVSYTRKRILPWPGIEARKFDELIAEIWEDKLPERLQEALDQAALRSGHSA